MVAAQSMDVSERGVAVIQRAGRPVPLARELTSEVRHRLVASEVWASQAITVVGAYVPSRDASPAKIARKQRFLSQMTALARHWTEERLVFLGDLNIVSRQHVPRFSTFRSWEYDALDALERHGLVDAYALLYPNEQVHSWIGRKGAGYRYDYAFVSAGLVPYLVDCEYIHEPRELGLSDHAAVVLTLDLRRRKSRRPLGRCTEPTKPPSNESVRGMPLQMRFEPLHDRMSDGIDRHRCRVDPQDAGSRVAPQA